MRRDLAMSFAALVQEFFSDYLTQQRALSPATVASYRDAITLLLDFAERRLGKAPTDLQVADINRLLLSEFLDSLERDRGNSVRSRNARLAAIRSFMKFVARRDLSSMHFAEQALSVPMKRFERPMLGFLTRDQIRAVTDVPPATWLGHRDRLLLTLLYNTGARVSEVISIRVGHAVLGEAPCVHLHGKGRKQRSVPLWKETARELRAWLRLNGDPPKESPLLPTRQGHAMTRANVTDRLRIAVASAAARRPEMSKLTISPHTIRHTTAMHLLQSGVDVSVIALWLGHESPTTTHQYLEADLAMKERALARLAPPDVKSARYRPPDPLRRFLQAL